MGRRPASSKGVDFMEIRIVNRGVYNAIDSLKDMIDSSIGGAGAKTVACIHYMAGYVGAMQVFGVISQENHDLACDYLEAKLNAIEEKLLAASDN